MRNPLPGGSIEVVFDQTITDREVVNAARSVASDVGHGSVEFERSKRRKWSAEQRGEDCAAREPVAHDVSSLSEIRACAAALRLTRRAHDRLPQIETDFRGGSDPAPVAARQLREGQEFPNSGRRYCAV